MAGKPVLDSRDYPRHDADMLASLAHAKSPVSAIVWLVDISVSGGLVQCYEDIMEKEVVRLKVQLDRREKEIKGIVVRKGHDGEIFYYGLRFIGRGLHSKRAVKRVIGWLKER